MTFLYNAQWRPTMGHWGGGYSMGAFDPSAFNAEQIQRSNDVGSAFETMPMSLEMLSSRETTGAAEKANALALKSAFEAAISANGWEPAKGLLSLDDDEKIYKVHESLDEIADLESLDGMLLDHVNTMIKRSTGGRISDIAALRDAAYQGYEDYFNAYYVEDEEAKPGAPPKPPVVNPQTGKTAAPRAKKPPKKSQFTAVAIVGGVATAGLLLWWLSGKGSRLWR
jgi:hypothetical protein